MKTQIEKFKDDIIERLVSSKYTVSRELILPIQSSNDIDDIAVNGVNAYCRSVAFEAELDGLTGREISAAFNFARLAAIIAVTTLAQTHDLNLSEDWLNQNN